MRHTLLPLLSAAVLLGLAGGTRAADDDVKAILAKAVKAHGGDENITKYPAAQVKNKGKIVLPMLGETDFTQEVSYMLPDKIKEVLVLDVAGQKITVTSIFNGDKGSIDANGNAVPVTDAIKEVLKEAVYRMKVARVTPLLKDKAYELSSLGEVKVNDKPALGVQVKSKGHKDVSLYFDKETGLLAKIEARTVDPQTMKEITEERIITEYQKKDGVPVPKKVSVKHDGEKFIDAEVTEVKMLEKLDDSEFPVK
jgi:hypothetical protein